MKKPTWEKSELRANRMRVSYCFGVAGFNSVTPTVPVLTENGLKWVPNGAHSDAEYDIYVKFIKRKKAKKK